MWTGTFEQWLEALNEEARKRGYLGPPLSQQTGDGCWVQAYMNGDEPSDAIDEDERCT